MALFVSSTIPLLLTVVHLLLPGLLVALAAGVSRVLAVTVAPAVTVGLVAALSLLTTLTGLPWTPLSFWVLVAVSVGLVLGVRRLATRTAVGERLVWGQAPAAGDPVPWRALVVAAPLVAGAFAAAVAVWGMGGLTAINQEFDVLFHVNAVQLLTETHDADPAAIGAVNHFDHGSSSYPIAFHALAALTAGLGTSAVVASNALVALVPAVLGLGLSGLLWQLRLPAHAVAAPFVAISIAAFPTDLLWRGPVWPFALGVALVPAFMAVLVGAVGEASRSAALLAALGAAGLLAVHPSAALGAAVFAAAYLIQRWAGGPSRLRTDLVPLLAIAVTAVLLSLPAVATALASSGYGVDYDWPASQTPGAAVGDLLMFNYDTRYPQWVLAALLVVGLVAVRRLAIAAWWLAGSAVFTVLMVLAAAYEGPAVALLTGPWWNDRFRFSALAVLGLAVVCTHGLVVSAGALTTAVRRSRVSPRIARPAVALVVCLTLFGVFTAGFYARHIHDRMQLKYALGSGGSVTAGELEAMEVLAGLVGPGQTVMNDPGDGSAWMWALHGIRPMFGQAIVDVTRPPLEAPQRTVLFGFNCIDSDPEVRQVVEQYEIRYVYVGEGFILPHMVRAEGMANLADSRSLRPVYENGETTIYEIELSDLVPPSEDAACSRADGTD
jgi:hypothetical protein